MKKQFLLTGATGALGSCVSAQLAGTGAAIRALVLPGDRSAARLPDGVERVEGDLLDDGALERLFSVPAGTATDRTNLAVTVTGLTPETTYTFYATATNNAATPVGVDSAVATFTTGAGASAKCAA